MWKSVLMSCANGGIASFFRKHPSTLLNTWEDVAVDSSMCKGKVWVRNIGKFRKRENKSVPTTIHFQSAPMLRGRYFEGGKCRYQMVVTRQGFEEKEFSRCWRGWVLGKSVIPSVVEEMHRLPTERMAASGNDNECFVPLNSVYCWMLNTLCLRWFKCGYCWVFGSRYFSRRFPGLCIIFVPRAAIFLK